MSNFIDALGREWSFSITVIEVKRLREEINLMRARVVYALSDDAAKKETT